MFHLISEPFFAVIHVSEFDEAFVCSFGVRFTAFGGGVVEIRNVLYDKTLQIKFN